MPYDTQNLVVITTLEGLTYSWPYTHLQHGSFTFALSCLLLEYPGTMTEESDMRGKKRSISHSI